MKREELIHFMTWWDKKYYPARLQFHREKDADAYLAAHPLPPAEGANLATREELINLIIDHSTGATDNIADGVWYKLLADEILKRQSIPANNGIPTREENPKGLHQRYIISKTDGEPVDDKAEYFVLRVDKNGNDPIHIAACRKAVIVYANAIKDHLPELSKDLIARYSDGEPTAEGAEEILIDDIEAIADKYEIVERIDDDPDTGDMRFVINDQFVELVRVAAVKFATLHAQRIAEKMVGERLRELMLGLLNSMSSNQFDNGDLTDIVDEYLKSRGK